MNFGEQSKGERSGSTDPFDSFFGNDSSTNSGSGPKVQESVGVDSVPETTTPPAQLESASVNRAASSSNGTAVASDRKDSMDTS